MIGLIGVFHVWFSTMTPVPVDTWKLMQNFFSMLIVLFAGWAGLHAYIPTKKMVPAAVAGAVTGAVGFVLFTAALLWFTQVWTDRLVQFPWAADRIKAAGLTVAQFLRSEEGQRGLQVTSLGSFLQMVPCSSCKRRTRSPCFIPTIIRSGGCA